MNADSFRPHGGGGSLSTESVIVRFVPLSVTVTVTIEAEEVIAGVGSGVTVVLDV